MDLMTRLNDKYPRMSKGHKKICEYIMEHYDQAAFMTAATLGKTLGISESTVVRFAMGLSYEGYPEFQSALASWVKMELNQVQKIGIKYANSSQSDVLQSVLTQDAQKIVDTLESVDADAFEAALEIILNAKHVYIVGIRSCQPLADFLHFYLNMIRADVLLVKTTSASELFEQMIRVDHEDAVIGISFPRYSMRTLKAMEFANARNAKVISITDSNNSPMCIYSSCNLTAKSEMVSIVDSLVAPLSIINALVVALCLNCPNEVKDNLTALEDTWNNYQVYLNDEINFIDEEQMLLHPLKKE